MKKPCPWSVGVILFVACAGGGGHIERPMAWCISLIPKKLKNENPKNKILKIEKSKIQNLKKKKIAFVAISSFMLSLKFSI